MNLEQMVADTMLKQVLRTPEGRAILLTQAADAEDNGEAALFDEAIELVDDPRFRKMIERHKSDEIRHGQMFTECARRQGVPLRAVPSELKALEYLDAEYDGFFSRPLSSIDDVVRAYAVLQALEERAVLHFGMIDPLFRLYDPKTADTFAAVAQDEERHLLYCQAITKHYARSESHLDAELSRAREVEAVAFERTRRATARHIDRMGVIENPIMRIVWRTMTRRSAAVAA